MKLILPYVQQKVSTATHCGPGFNNRSHYWDLELACGHHKEHDWRKGKLPPCRVRCYECPRAATEGSEGLCAR